MHPDFPLTDAEIVREAVKARAMYETHATRKPEAPQPQPVPYKERL